MAPQILGANDAWSIGQTLLLSSVLRYDVCAFYHERTRHESELVRRAVDVDDTARYILDTLGATDARRGAACLAGGVVTRLMLVLGACLESMDSLRRRQGVIRRRAIETSVFIYFNAVQYGGAGDASYDAFCRHHLRRELAKLKSSPGDKAGAGEVEATFQGKASRPRDDHAYDVVKRRLHACEAGRKYVMGYPGHPSMCRLHSPMRVFAGRVLGFCQLAARVAVDGRFQQTCHIEDDDLTELVVWSIIVDDLQDGGGVVMQRVVQMAYNIGSKDLRLQGVPDPEPLPRLSTAALVQAFHAWQSPAALLEDHFQAVWRRFYAARGPIDDAARLLASLPAAGEEGRLLADLPDAAFTDEEARLLAPVLSQEGVTRGAPAASRLRATEVWAMWRSLSGPVPATKGHPTVADRAEHWVRVLKFLRYCARSARVDLANRRAPYIRQLRDADEGRLFRYLEAKALATSTEDQRRFTARWLATVGYWLGDGKCVAMGAPVLLTRWLCAYVEKVPVDPLLTTDFVLFPARPPPIPHGHLLTLFAYHAEALARARSELVSTAVVAALLFTVGAAAREDVRLIPSADAVASAAALLGSDAVRERTLRGVVEALVDLFWPTHAEQRACKPKVERLRGQLLRVCTPHSRRQEGEFLFTEQIQPPAAAEYVVYHFTACSMNATCRDKIPEGKRALLPWPEARAAVDGLLRQAAEDMRAVVAWSRAFFPGVHAAHLAGPLVDAFPAHEELLRAGGLAVPPRPALGRDQTGRGAVLQFILDCFPVVLARHQALCDEAGRWLRDECGGGEVPAATVVDPPAEDPAQPLAVPPGAEVDVHLAMEMIEAGEVLSPEALSPVGMDVETVVERGAAEERLNETVVALGWLDDDKPDGAPLCSQPPPDLGADLPAFEDTGFDFGQALEAEEARGGAF